MMGVSFGHIPTNMARFPEFPYPYFVVMSSLGCGMLGFAYFIVNEVLGLNNSATVIDTGAGAKKSIVNMTNVKSAKTMV